MDKREWKFDKYDVVANIYNRAKQFAIHTRAYDIDRDAFFYVVYTDSGVDWFLADYFEEMHAKMDLGE